MVSKAHPSASIGTLSAEEIATLDASEVRAALLARGIGLSEAEVVEALARLRETTGAQRAGSSRQRLVVTSESSQLRAGAPAGSAGTSATLGLVVDWFEQTLFVGG